MSYDFDKEFDRRNTNSEKWDVLENELPMWIADMDFQTAPEIMEAMKKSIDGGIFGYQFVPDSYYEAVKNWFELEHNFKPETDWMVFSTGVMPSISAIIRHLTDVGDNILLQEPNYNSFYKAIESNGRNVTNSELTYKNDAYQIDWEDLKNKLSDPQTTVMIVCNPHNPTGHIWDAKTLSRIGQLAKDNDVLIISDEIHGDLSMPNNSYIPFASLDESIIDNSISLVSPTKTFNLAMLHASTLFVPNENLRNKVRRAISIDGHNEPGILAIDGTIAAYTKGHDWLSELRQYISINRQLLSDYVAKNIPELTVLKSDATYLAWIDCTKVTDDSAELNEFIRKETGLYLAEGTKYRGNGSEFLRMNLATNKSRVQDGLNRLERGIHAYINK
ncbi:pyridoxal phosphate-dependent aminotransferase [Companilactobacillus allii]|uniref:cysteine-S-conjugate beta-lyase n=1 Tax=Companilactobacillus allii TaxID=1847728 RepID=A0A1P8Q105_9LACO|nr:MalY/PatB family protein [Companilactobacillus allii]APX71479.1 plastocyanin [Companilactobacillus allii]USQ68560.1 pyridoxal phosphate-dependent aminotransferase [Companilactobacillus allii]